MSKARPDRPIGARSSEQTALDRVVQRLVQQFPELTREEILLTVQGRYAAFMDSPVRDFVPVLVERAARGELGGPEQRGHRA